MNCQVRAKDVKGQFKVGFYKPSDQPQGQKGENILAKAKPGFHFEQRHFEEQRGAPARDAAGKF